MPPSCPESDFVEAPAVVVIADHHEATRAALCSELRSLGHRVDEAASGTDLRETLERSLRDGAPPSLIVVDVHMPGCGGLDIIRAFHARIPPQRFLVLAAFQDSGMLSRAAELGAAGVLVRPIPLRHLVSLVTDLVQSSRFLPHP